MTLASAVAFVALAFVVALLALVLLVWPVLPRA